MNQPIAPMAIDDNSIDRELATTLKAAGDPLRLDILRLLAKDSFGVMELANIFDIKQSGMSHHLKVLANARLVATRREGNSIFYRRALPDPTDLSSPLLDALFAVIDSQPSRPPIKHNVGAIKQERARASEQFFTSNVDKFRAQQDLIASYPVYADAVEDLLDRIELPDSLNALEIGPGEGEFLLSLAPRFKHVVALDTSSSLLLRARQRCEGKNLLNVEFVHGDSAQALQDKRRFDCAIINMVLHHVASPAEIFEHLGRLLKPGGSALITDLCHHDQQWARDACGDLWLGFEPDELTRWAQLAGLEEGASQYIALRNGFQIQLRQFLRPTEDALKSEEA